MKAADLRKSILQVAVHGKLVPQDKNDEPASELLKRIQAEKAALIKAGKLKKEKPLLPITEDEIPYDLPDGWVWCRLNEIYNFIDYRGKTPTKTESGIPLITGANIKNGRMDYSQRWFISETEYSERQRRGISKKGDIIFTTEAPLGHAALADLEVFSTGQRIITLQAYNISINNTLFLYFLLSADLQNRITLKKSGMTASGIKASLLKQVLIPLPSLAEQQRIVAKVDELMALCDELEAAEKEQDALESYLAEGLPKSILQAAVQGKLVPQGKDDEPASELLERIRAEKAALIKAGKLKSGKALPPVSEEEVPYDLPEGWVWCRLGDISIINPRNTLPDNATVSFIPMPLISSEYFGGHQQEIKLWGELKSGFTHFAEGDVLLAKITPCFQNGKSCIACNLHSGYGAGTTELHVLRCILIEAQYLLLFLKNPFFIAEAKRNMTGTAGQQRVPTEYLQQFPLPLPPLAEQQRIVAKVDELMALCEELKHVDAQPIDHGHIIPFPATAAVNPDPIAMAARGDADKLSIQAQQAADALLPEDE